MRIARFLLLVTLLAEALLTLAPAQESAFELPVQLIGFPVIIVAVRLSNFVKKLAYSLNPRTYASRSRRNAELGVDPAMDVVEVEKKLIREFGAHVCIFERVCEHYAALTQTSHGNNHVLDWETIFGEYKTSPSASKQNYLLSVFLGDIVASPGLCHALAKRGRACREELHHREAPHVHRVVARKGNLNAQDTPHPDDVISHKGDPDHHHPQHPSSSHRRRVFEHRRTARPIHAIHHSTSHDSNGGSHEVHDRLHIDHPAQVPRRH